MIKTGVGERGGREQPDDQDQGLTLELQALMLSSVQVNIRAEQLPPQKFSGAPPPKVPVTAP
jgi:hypothetical protein